MSGQMLVTLNTDRSKRRLVFQDDCDYKINMKLLLISAVLLQAWCYALPKPNGVASYSYQDSSGKRYGGTYDLGDVSPFSEPIISPYREAYVPEFFNNFGNILPHDNLGRLRRRMQYRHLRPMKSRMFGSDIKSQMLALHAAKKALDLTYNSGYNPPFFRFPFGGYPFGGFGPFNMNRLSHNSAFSSAAVGPGYSHQSAIINPPNAENPNVDVTNRFSKPSGPENFYSVSSSSFASSNNDNGKVTGFRGAETVVNDNGKITKYKVHS